MRAIYTSILIEFDVQKKLTLIITLIILAAGFSTGSDTYAQAPAAEGVELKLVQYTQNPFTKEVKFDVVIQSFISSDRVQIEWDVSGASELVTEKTDTIQLRPGEIYRRSAIILPRQRGATDIIVRVQAFQADGIYTGTQASLIGSHADGTVFPYNPLYQEAQIIYYTQLVATWGLLLYLLVLAGLWLMQYLARRRLAAVQTEQGY